MKTLLLTLCSRCKLHCKILSEGLPEMSNQAMSLRLYERKGGGGGGGGGGEGGGRGGSEGRRRGKWKANPHPLNGI